MLSVESVSCPIIRASRLKFSSLPITINEDNEEQAVQYGCSCSCDTLNTRVHVRSSACHLHKRFLLFSIKLIEEEREKKLKRTQKKRDKREEGPFLGIMYSV